MNLTEVLQATRTVRAAEVTSAANSPLDKAATTSPTPRGGTGTDPLLAWHSRPSCLGLRAPHRLVAAVGTVAVTAAPRLAKRHTLRLPRVQRNIPTPVLTALVIGVGTIAEAADPAIMPPVGELLEVSGDRRHLAGLS